MPEPPWYSGRSLIWDQRNRMSHKYRGDGACYTKNSILFYQQQQQSIRNKVFPHAFSGPSIFREQKRKMKWVTCDSRNNNKYHYVVVVVTLSCKYNTHANRLPPAWRRRRGRRERVEKSCCRKQNWKSIRSGNLLTTKKNIQNFIIIIMRRLCVCMYG